MAPEGDLERKLVCFYEYIFPGSNRVLCEVINWVVHDVVLGIVHGVMIVNPRPPPFTSTREKKGLG